MGQKQKRGALPPVKCPFCPKQVNGEHGLSDHLFEVHRLGIGNRRISNNVREGRKLAKHTSQPQADC